MRRKRSGLPPMLGRENFSTWTRMPRYPKVMQTDAGQYTTERHDAIAGKREQPDTDDDDEQLPGWSCLDLNRPGRMEALAELEDVLEGITFQKISRWGQPIEIRRAKECYL